MAQQVSFRDSAYGAVVGAIAGGANPAIFDWVVKYSGEHTTVGPAAGEAKTLGGVLSTDVVLALISFTGSTPRTLLTAVPTTDTITFTFDGNPNTGTAHRVFYMVLRQLS